ncbi:MAG: hypothetical protein M3Y51_01675 [Actinomycetota bacterium]|nr:hypothetical protein [Actinomycetota bacterium]
MLTHDDTRIDRPGDRFAAPVRGAAAALDDPTPSEPLLRGVTSAGSLADAAASLGLLPAACAVLRDDAAPAVLRDRARYVVERALRERERSTRR